MRQLSGSRQSRRRGQGIRPGPSKVAYGRRVQGWQAGLWRKVLAPLIAVFTWRRLRSERSQRFGRSGSGGRRSLIEWESEIWSGSLCSGRLGYPCWRGRRGLSFDHRAAWISKRSELRGMQIAGSECERAYLRSPLPTYALMTSHARPNGVVSPVRCARLSNVKVPLVCFRNSSSASAENPLGRGTDDGSKFLQTMNASKPQQGLSALHTGASGTEGGLTA